MIGSRHRPSRPARAGAVLLASLAGLSMLACSRSEEAGEPPPTPPGPNVFLVVLDTVRADRLSVYGHGRPTSPRLEALAAEGVRFDAAWSTSSWTPPAHASLFTGLYPVAHRVTQENWTLSSELDTLAELLAGCGYETAAFVGNPTLSPERGFDQGFERYFMAWKEARRPPRLLPDRASAEAFAAFVRERATLDAASPARPFFAFVNLIGPHSPYTSCRPQCSRWVEDKSKKLRANGWHHVYLGRRSHSAADLEHLRGLYDAELHRADEWLGLMLDALRESGALDDTLVIVTSDHGENIGDHGHVDHVFSLYDSTTRVPLVVRYPKAFEGGTRDVAPAQLPDVFTTIASLTGLRDTVGVMQGIDLRDVAARRARPILLSYGRPVQALSGVLSRAKRTEEVTPAEEARLVRWDRALTAIVHHGLKLVEASDGTRELYDLRADPGETQNLAGRPEHEADVAALSARLAAQRDVYAEAAVSGARPRPLTPETRRALEAIGYLEE